MNDLPISQHFGGYCYYFLLQYLFIQIKAFSHALKTTFVLFLIKYSLLVVI